MKKKTISLFMAAALACSVNTAVFAEEASAVENLAENQEVTFQLTADATTLDTIQTGTTSDQRCAAPVYEGLLRREMDESGNLILVPGAAESYDVDETETVYTFHLQPNGKFSDGTPVTAEDVVYSWQRAFDPALASSQSWQLEGILLNATECFNGEKPLEELGIKAVDEMTVEITLVSPNPNFLTITTFPFVRIVSKAFVEECGTKFGSAAEYVMGSGAYKLTSWEPGSSMTYEPNENYWDAEDVYLTKLNLQVVSENSTLAQALMGQQIDIAELNDADWNDLVDQLGYYDVNEVPEMSAYFFLFNCDTPQLSNWKIRLALSLGFDRERYNNEVYGGKYVPAYSFEPEIATVGDSLWTDVAGDSVDVLKTLAEKYPDPKALLIEGMEDAGLGSDPSALTINYTTLGVTETVKKSAEWLKQELETNLGITLNIELTEWNIAYDLIDAGDYEMAFGGWSVDSGTEPMRLLKLFDAANGYYNSEKIHWTGEKADEYSEYAVEMQETFDADRLLELYASAEPILLEEAPVSPVYFTKMRALVATDIVGYQVHPFLLPDFVGVARVAE